MIQIYIAAVIFFILGFWACAILTAAKCEAHEAFGEELSEIILKQMDEIDKLEEQLNPETGMDLNA